MLVQVLAPPYLPSCDNCSRDPSDIIVSGLSLGIMIQSDTIYDHISLNISDQAFEKY